MDSCMQMGPQIRELLVLQRVSGRNAYSTMTMTTVKETLHAS